MSDRVLLTGVSGFLGGHLALQLLNAGYTVRGSVRNLEKAEKVRATLRRAGADVSRLEFVTLDLAADAGWDAAMADCRYLQHTASPLLLHMPADRNDLIGPAVDGTTRAITAALGANVARIVLTSSMAAIAYGHDRARTAPFTAADWTDLASRAVNAYVESKTRAERRAWELMDAAGRHGDLATINPSGIFGPLLDDDPGTSAIVVQRLLNGSIPAAPRISMTTVDVRDVAAAHVAAMTEPGAGGQRFPMGLNTMMLMDVARLLRQQLPAGGQRTPRFEMPDWAVRLYGLFDKDVRDNLGELGVVKQLDSTPTTALLGRDLIPADAAFLATANSLIAHNLV